MIIIIFRGGKAEGITLLYHKLEHLWRGPTQKWVQVLYFGARTPSPGAIALGPVKSTTVTLSVRKRKKCQKFITIQGPYYCHLAVWWAVAEYSLGLLDYRFTIQLF